MSDNNEFSFDSLDELEAEPIIQEEKYEDKTVTGIQFGFIGVGQGGSRLADSFYNIGYRKVILFNTNRNDMEGVSTPKNGWVIVEGMNGAGKNPEFGEKAAKAVIADVVKKMNQRFQGVKQIIVCVGAGGGTGTGAAAVIAEACKQWIYNNTGDTSGRKVGFLIALPARSESSRVLANTDYLLSRIIGSDYSPVLLVDNQRITASVKVNALNKWTHTNNMVCGLLHTFNMMCAKTTPHDTFDPQDYAEVLKNGVATIAMTSIAESAVKVEEDTGLAKATLLSDRVKLSLSSNLLLQDVDISTATHAAVIISCTDRALEQMDADSIPKLQETIISMMGGDLGKSVSVFRGLYTREEGDSDTKIRIFTMFSGMKFPENKINEYKRASSLKKD